MNATRVIVPHASCALAGSPWQRFLRGPRAAWLTHGSLLAMTVVYFGVAAHLPFWMALCPAVVLAHRIGVMLHEYIHGIPFRRYRDCLAVVTFFDGLLLLFGLLELFRGTHLSHHRWLNQPGDSGFRQAQSKPAGRRWIEVLTALVWRLLEPGSRAHAAVGSG